jgi:hypothetical protein
MTDPRDHPNEPHEPDQQDMLVNSESAARMAVEAGLVDHISAQRIRRLASPPDQGGDPDWPQPVPSVGRGRWYWWSQVRRYFERRTVSRVPRRHRPIPPSGDPGPAAAAPPDPARDG